MGSQVPEDLISRITTFLAHQRTGVISTIPTKGIWAIPVWYRPRPSLPGKRGLEVDCLVPRWSDVAYQLTQETRVLLIVQASSSAGLRWLQIHGTVQPVEAPDWDRLLPRWVSTTQPDALYMVVWLKPSRIDLFDEDLGWGVQATLEW